MKQGIKSPKVRHQNSIAVPGLALESNNADLCTSWDNMSILTVYLRSIVKVMTCSVMLRYPTYPFEELAFLLGLQLYWNLCLSDFFPQKHYVNTSLGAIFLWNAMSGIISVPLWKDSAGPQGCEVFSEGACAQLGCRSAEVRAWNRVTEPSPLSISGKSSCSS